MEPAPNLRSGPRMPSSEMSRDNGGFLVPFLFLFRSLPCNLLLHIFSVVLTIDRVTSTRLQSTRQTRHSRLPLLQQEVAPLILVMHSARHPSSRVDRRIFGDRRII